MTTQESPPNPPSKVLIVGAGTTALLLAQSLRKTPEIPFQLAERFSNDSYYHRQREWGLTLHWGTAAIRSVLPASLLSRIKEIWVDPNFDVEQWKLAEREKGREVEWSVPMYRGDTGEKLFEVGDEETMRISRRKMRSLFTEGLGDGAVAFEKKLVDIRPDGEGVTAVFEDGTEVGAKLIVGCDGAKSKVREVLVGKERNRREEMGVWLINFPVRFQDARTARMLRAWHPIYVVSHHPDDCMCWVSVMDVPDAARPETWSFQLMFSWMKGPSKNDLQTQQERTLFLKSKAARFTDPWRSVLEQIPDDVEFGIDEISVWKPFDWSDSPLAGKVTLAGDAAHVLPPFRGQGLNNALLDAAELSEALLAAPATDAGWRDAVFRYEKEMRERLSKEFPLSIGATYMAHDFGRILESPVAKVGIRKPEDERQDSSVQAK